MIDIHDSKSNNENNTLSSPPGNSTPTTLIEYPNKEDQMFRHPIRPLVAAILISGGSLFTLFLIQIFPLPASAASAMSPTIHHTVIPVNCTSTPNFTNEYSKISDFGTFEVLHPDSVVEATFNGRIDADTIVGTSGAVFELRVDDQPSPTGRARAVLRSGELTWGIQASISGVFPDLEAGEHTASLWVRAGASGSGTGGRVDPGCWSSDYILVREYTPFGSVYLPGVTR
jgi:hypothetical protein